MKKSTITEIKAAAKAQKCVVKKAKVTLNSFPAYNVITREGTRNRLMTKDDVVDQFMRGDLFE